MDRALTELAEATRGLNSDLSWTLDEDISRRQVGPVFNRCASGNLSAEQALDVCMDCMNAKLAYTMEVFDGLFTRLASRITERFGDTHFEGMIPLQEFFMGLGDSAPWIMNDKIARGELRPVFVRCSEGSLSPHQALDIFVDNMVAKRDYTLQLLQEMVLHLAVEIVANSKTSASVRVDDDESS